MDSIIRNVKDIEADKRSAFESVIGRKLRDNQQLFIQVIDVGVEPDEETRRNALDRAAEIARQGRANAAAQGVSEEEIDRAIDEAMHHVRRPNG
jgi:hypothetical protein